MNCVIMLSRFKNNKEKEIDIIRVKNIIYLGRELYSLEIAMTAQKEIVAKMAVLLKDKMRPAINIVIIVFLFLNIDGIDANIILERKIFSANKLEFDESPKTRKS